MEFGKQLCQANQAQDAQDLQAARHPHDSEVVVPCPALIVFLIAERKVQRQKAPIKRQDADVNGKPSPEVLDRDGSWIHDHLASTVKTVEEIGWKVDGPEDGAHPIHKGQDLEVKLESCHRNREDVPDNQNETNKVPCHSSSRVRRGDAVLPEGTLGEGLPRADFLEASEIARNHAGQGSVGLRVIGPFEESRLLKSLKLVLRHVIIIIVGMKCVLLPGFQSQSQDSFIVAAPLLGDLRILRCVRRDMAVGSKCTLEGPPSLGHGVPSTPPGARSRHCARGLPCSVAEAALSC
mmetsp:Transcript_16319/g.38609  ORF Transcript_16319/g.38609 Transcript_16319/m.38609 type:complete len:293 (+) Transcript_16319:1270-2148(+)